jgi:hypothetical protein
LIGGGAALCLFLTGALAYRALRPASGVEAIAAHSTPGVVSAIRDMARLEATEFHVEKVVQVTDAQSHLWGLLRAKDDLLLVAVGDVVAGVDLSGVRPDDTRIDWAARSIRVRVPAPEIFASKLDEKATYVFTRATDVLAVRNEQLEGAARRAAEDQMRATAIERGILDRARASADRTLAALLGSMGFEHVELDWSDRG